MFWVYTFIYTFIYTYYINKANINIERSRASEIRNLLSFTWTRTDHGESLKLNPEIPYLFDAWQL